MDLNLSFYGCLCSTSEFDINGITADYRDFGEKYDRSPYNADPHGCGDMQFNPTIPTDSILTKYGISLEEYTEVCRRLKEGLSFGCCGWCI